MTLYILLFGSSTGHVILASFGVTRSECIFEYEYRFRDRLRGFTLGGNAMASTAKLATLGAGTIPTDAPG